METLGWSAYLYKVFWNWLGVLLAIDGVAALTERYFGDSMERKFHWKMRLPASIKLGFAVLVLFIAQGIAYRDTQRELAQAGRDNDGLHSALNIITAQIESQKREIANLRSPPSKIVTRAAPTREPGKQCWISNYFGFPNSTIKGVVTATAVIIHCNYKIDAPFRVYVEFDRDFIPGALVLPGAGVVSGGRVRKEGRIYLGQINSPALLSHKLAIVTVYGTTDQYPRVVRGSIEALK